MTWSPKARRFWPLFALVLLTDCATKRAAELHLVPAQVPHELLGEMVRLTLAYNPGAAMSLSLGAHSRLGFSLLAVGALIVMAHLYRRTAPGDRQAAGGLALIAAGAVGNLLDRLRSERGVVDFIDIGVGGWRFWTFNVADMAILLGAVVLVLALHRMDAGEEGSLSRW
ncbi:MAG TPA: signal peptidase II [Gemmatimonadales bacterium]|nr:signal peptidase II [Gemmatimonadales bacterium]